MKNENLLRTVKLHLGLSAFIVIAVSLAYGYSPSETLPVIFGFPVEHLELKNIFRAIMGLYLAFGIFWVVGLVCFKFLRTAILTHILFMGGLAFGRLVSTIFDGISLQYGIGMILETIFMLWGLYNLKKVNKLKL